MILLVPYSWGLGVEVGGHEMGDVPMFVTSLRICIFQDGFP